MNKKSAFQRLLSILLCLAMVASYLPTGIMTAVAEGSATALNITKVADPSTKDAWDAYFDHGAEISTDNAGAIWTDKSVFTDASAFSNVEKDTQGNDVSITMKNPNDMLVALSAMASNMTVSGQASVPTDTMLVLDVSGSMNEGNNDVAKELAEAANSTIGDLLSSNPNNRVGVVLYSGPLYSGDPASDTDAVVLLPLGRYTTGTDKQYIQYGTRTEESDDWWDDDETFEVISLDADVVIEGTTTKPTSASKDVLGATYIQKGVILAMNQFIAASNQTTVNGVTRKPVMVLMSDGAPTVSSTNFTNPTSYNLGNGQNSSTNAAQGFVTQLSCAYAKARIETKYGTDSLFYTVGLGTTGNEVATSVLDPVNSNSGIDEFWTRYNAASVGGTVNVQGNGNNARRVTKIETALEQNYVDKYIAVTAGTDLAQGLKDAFAAIVSDIQLQSKYFPTLVDDSHSLSGYISFVDKIGEYMSVKDVKGILLHEQLFSGHHLAENFVEGGGIFGTEAEPTAAGTAMMESVRDRLGVGSDETARALINNAYYYGQLAFDPATGEFSNYIGWYADAQGNYMGFYQEGVTTLPDDAVYTVKSYGFLGETDPAHGVSASDMMYATVQVRHNIATSEEEMILKVPASLIPTITYEVELDSNGQLESLTQSGASYPFRLLYEVGLDPHINSLNLTEYVSDEYLAANRNTDGSISFYSNQYEVDNSTGYGKVNTYAHFNPSHQNDKYYFQANAMVYSDQNGTLYDGTTAPKDYTGTLYRQHISYKVLNGQPVTDVHYHELATEGRAAAVQTSGESTWYIPEGTVYTNLSGFTYYKGYASQYDASQNLTGTLTYAKQPFVDIHNYNVSDTNHNFTVGSTLGNNGKLTVMPATGIKLTKEMAEGVADPGTAFTFTIENLINTSDGGTYAAVLEETDGTQTDTSVTFSGGKATVELKAGQTLYITGLTAGTQLKITETETADYVVSSVNGSTGNSATVTVVANQMVAADFVNTERGKGNLMITKELTHAQEGHTIPNSVLQSWFMVSIDLGSEFAGKDVQVNDGTTTGGWAVPANGILNLQIKHGQTLGILDLPEGTQVTVTELTDNLPKYLSYDHINSRDHSGATLDNDGTVTIGNNTNSTVIVHNQYDPIDTTVDLSVTVNKDFLIDTPPASAAFTFELQEYVNGAWSYVDSGTVTYTNESGRKSINLPNALDRIVYDEVGDHAYQIIEVIPADADRLPGVTYDRTTHTFSVHVTDNAGQLVATVMNDGVVVGGTHEVTFTNTYHEAPVSIDVIKEIPEAAEFPEITKTGFRFDAYEANADWTLVDDEADKTVFSDAVGEARFTATYTEAGTHYFVVKETSDGKAGWTYDDTQYRVTVVVTEETDGSKVADITIIKVTTDDTGTEVTEAVNGTTITFTNHYTPASKNVDLDAAVKKNLEGRTLKAGEFTFAVFENGKASHTSTAGALLTGTNAADGSVNFSGTAAAVAAGTATADGSLVYSKIGTYEYDVVEMTGDLGGVTYSTRIYDLVVEVTDNGSGQLNALYYFEDATTQTVTFTNTYSAKETSYTVTGNKTLTGRAMINDEFTFVMTEVADANGTALNDAKTWTTTNTMAGGISFPAITYTAAGTHYYKVSEVQQATAGGITFDQTSYIVTVTVTDNGEGQLIASAVVDGEEGKAITFANSYVPAKTSSDIPGTKTLEGKVLGAGAYSFQLYDSNENWENLGAKGQPVSNGENGSFAFPAIEYTAAGTYYYLVKEVDGGQTIEGVTYDDSVFRVRVTVTDDLKGQLHATTVVFDENDIPQIGVQFVNTYAVTGDASLVLTGTKTLEGRDLVNDEFTFELYAADEDHTVSGDPIATDTNAAGQFAIKLDYTADNDLGKTYYYVLREKNAGKTIDGVTYATTEYKITVKVEDDTVGGLKLTVTTDGQQSTENKLTTVTGLNFQNTYEAEPAPFAPEGTKELTGDIRDLKAGDFTFELYKTGATFAISGQPVATAKNDAYGDFTFASQDLESVGNHYFVVKESTEDPIGGVTYDAAQYRITVKVTDDGKGQLQVESTAYLKYTTTATTTANGISFSNHYDPADATVDLSGLKSLSGNKTLAADMFTFQLYKTDSTFSTDGVTPVEKKNDTTGFSFDTLTFDTEDTHYYVLKEANGGQKIDGITHDDTEYKITVKVEDDEKGKLIPTVTVDGANVSVTDNVATVTGLNFSNSYSAEPVKFTPEATKRYERPDGEEMKEFTFTLKGEGENQTKKNDASGKVTFDELTFSEAKTYTYTITETPDSAWSFIKWDTNVYTLSVEVIDNGKGEMEIKEITTTSVKGSDDLIFLNAHEDLILKKDVVLENSSVSIDGKAVEKGDVLVYKLTYRNFNNQVVDATVTDTLPQYTEFVSADNGGTYANGKVTWNLEDVAIGGSVTVSFQVKVTGGVGQTLTNQAEVLDAGNTYTSNEITNPVKEDKATKDVVLPTADTVSIDGKAVDKGDILLYKVTYTNSDDFAASVTITDTIPEHTTYVTGSASDKGVYADGKVTWNLQLAAGESKTVTFQVKVSAVNITVTNQATAVEGTNTIETNQVNNPVKEDKVEKDVVLADGTATIDGKKVEKGDVLTYKITYQNADDFAADVTITDTLPNGTTYVTGSASDNGAYASGKVTWNLKLAAKETKTVTFQVTVTGTAGTQIANQATGIEGENTYTTTSVTNSITEDEVSKDVFMTGNETVSIDGKKVEKGDVLTYKITYKNNDSFDAQVKITDVIPAYTSYVEGSASDGGTLAGSTLTWNVPVPAGTTKTVTFKVTVTGAAEQTIVNKATALEGNNTLTTEEVKNPITEDEVKKNVFMAGDETVSIDGQLVEKGDVLTYKVTYQNTDDFTADVTITDTIPAHTEYVANSASDGASFAGGKLTWNLQLAAGETKEVTFQVKVTDTKVTVENTAQAKEGNNQVDTNTTRTPVDQDLVTKEVFTVSDPTVNIDGKKVDKGDILVYKITYKNLDGFAAKVTITDTIPEHTEYVDGSADNGAAFADGKLTWNLQLAAGEEKSVTFQVKVTGSSNTTVTNQATAVEGENTIQTNKVENPVTDDELKKDVVLPGSTDISIDGEKVNVGQILQYQITYKNTDDLAADVTITDTIPAHTTYVDGSATDKPVYTNNKLVWTLKLAAGEEKTVSFQVKVIDTNVTVSNQATAQEGENKYETNKTTSPVEGDELTKDAHKTSDPTVSVDGKQVAMGETLTYTITYKNTDVNKATVTVTDMIPANTTYVEGSATNGGIFANGTLTWTLELAAGESKTVSFQVKVNEYKVTVANQATASDGTNKLVSNQVTFTTPAAPETPYTGDNMNLILWFGLLAVSATALAAAFIFRKKILN